MCVCVNVVLVKLIIYCAKVYIGMFIPVGLIYTSSWCACMLLYLICICSKNVRLCVCHI